jgi:hypothetical protein
MAKKKEDYNAADKFSWKSGDLETAGFCPYCVHKFNKAAACLAFPKGIPDVILSGDVRHDLPFSDQVGVFIYEPKANK